MDVSITMSLYYKHSADGYNLEVVPLPFDQRSIPIPISPKNTDAIQCAGMIEVVVLPCYHTKTRPNVFYAFLYSLSSTVDDFGSNVANVLSDSKYTRTPLAHALPIIM